jgi:hypothetical protein
LGEVALRRGFAFALIAAVFACAGGARASAQPADFSGVYLGLDLGYGAGASGDWCYCTFLPSVTDATGGEGGIFVAGEAGYGVRLGPIMIEAAARAGHADIRFAEICAGGVTCNGELAWIAEAQLSAGVVVFDNILIAGAISLAAADVHAQAGAGEPSTALHDGHGFAARIENAMSGGWRMGIEYRRYEMSGTNEAGVGDVDIEWSADTIGLVIHYELGE